jgi:hypothetical protein
MNGTHSDPKPHEPVTLDRLEAEISGIRADLADLRAEFSEQVQRDPLRREQVWMMVGGFVVGLGVAIVVALAIP